MDYTVVTRHTALVAYLLELGVITSETRVLSHAKEEDVLNKDIIGVLPLHLACWTKSISEVPLNLTPDMRGRELTLEEVRACAQPLVTYIVDTQSMVNSRAILLSMKGAIPGTEKKVLKSGQPK